MKKKLNLDKLKELELSYAEKMLENEALDKTNRTLAQDLERLTTEIVNAGQDLKKKSIEIETLKSAQRESEKINKTLISISNAVNTTVNLDELYRFIHMAIDQIIDSTNFIIAIHDPLNRTFSIPYYMDTMDAIPPLNMNNPHDIDSSVLTGTVLKDGRPLLIKKSEIVKLMNAKQKRVFGTVAEVWLGVPLKIQNRIIGVMITQSYTDPNRYNERDVEFLTSVSEQVALAIERTRAVDALKQNEERYRTLVDNLDDIFFSVDTSGRFIYLSHRFESITGYRANEIRHRRMVLIPADIQSQTIDDGCVYFDRLIHPEDQRTVLQTIHNAMQNRDAYRVEYRIIKKNGRINWVYEKGSMLEDPVNGKCLEGFIQDIHESRHAEEVNRVLFSISNAVNTAVNLDDLYKSIHYSLSRIVDVTNFFISLYDKQTDSIHCPYSVDAMEDSLSDMYHISSPDSNSHTAIVINTGKPVLHTKEDFLKYLRARNLKPAMTLSKIWLGVPLKIKDEVIGAIVVHSYTNPNLYEEKDVNILLRVSDQVALAIERKRVNEALKFSEEKYRTILESIEDGYYEVDPAGNIVFFNQSMCRILGYNEKELIGLNNRRYLDEFNTRKVYHAFNRMFQTGKPINRFDFEVITKGGEKSHIDASASLIVDEKNQPIGFRGIARDISEQKTAEKEKKMLESQLQRAQKMEAIGLLAGGVAHDLNNILAGLVSYPELLLMDLPEDSPLRRPIQTIQRAGEKAAAIVQDLLTLARRGVALAEAVNINDVITEYLRSPVFGLLQSYHPKVRVELDLEKDLFNTLGSPVHLNQTIMNLVSNAAEAMPEGGIIRIITANQYVDKPIRRYDQVEEGDYVTLKIIDNGIGISPHDIDRIFEPFYTKKVMGRSGTGLGMAVVWGTVKDHHGYIDVQSILGQGTTFILYFPITRRDLLVKDAPISRAEYMGNGETILVIDDMREQREIAVSILSRLGYQVTALAGGEEAVDYLKSRKVDLLVLDMVMDPGLDGLETYRQIIKIHPGQKAIIVSGFSESERVKELQKLGAGTYLRKPFLLQKIGLAIRSELTR